MRGYSYLGVLAAILPYAFILSSILLSPWFNIFNNALSDLGNYRNGFAAYIYNSGLVVGGSLVILFSIILIFRKRNKYFSTISLLLFLSGIFLTLIGVYAENSGRMHGVVSGIFFALIDISLLVYSYLSWPVGSPRTGLIALIFGILSAAIWAFRWPWHGVAIQETVTSMMTATWLIIFSLRVAGK